MVSVAALDIYYTNLQVFTRNFECTNAVTNDIEELVNGQLGDSATDQEKAFVWQCGDVDILLAGPPCQGHSNLNNHTRRQDERNVLYERVARFVELARPTHVLIENVPSVIHDKQRAMHRTVDVLVRLGYKVDSGMVDLADVGVPQRRQRHVVVASLTKTPSIGNIVRQHRVNNIRSVMWAIGDLQAPRVDGIFDTPASISETNRRRIDYLHDHDLYDLPNHQRPKCHADGNSYPSMYGRIKPDECAQTITGGFASPGQGRFVHPTQRRTLTSHEAARLQFFPDFFDFSSVKTRKALSKMIGNAVPMKLSYMFCLDFLA